MTALPDDFTSDQTACALQLLYVRSLCFNSMPMKGDDRHWFLALAEDIKSNLIEAGVPVSVMDDQDAKHGDSHD